MKKLIYIFLLFISSQLFAAEWIDFYSVEGKCKINFPQKPHHVEQMIPIEESNLYLKYDVYLTHMEEGSIYMMVIAQYPTDIDPKNHRASLEGFINGIMNHKNKNKLISADFFEFQGHNALDFHVERLNRSFKGRAMIVANRLYLLAMEADDNSNLDINYKKYIESFALGE